MMIGQGGSRPEGTSRWASAPPLSGEAQNCFPVITTIERRWNDLDLWDSWPLCTAGGEIVASAGRELWFMLSSQCFDDPVQRHGHARIRLMARDAAGWHDLGNALPDGFAPGSREWAGSAVLEDDGSTVTLYFTAAGRPEAPRSTEQRIFAACATLRAGLLHDWRDLHEPIVADGQRYMIAGEADGAVGTMKGFRDPAFFRDPFTGREHLLFTGSAGWDDDPHNGVIGIASRDREGAWTLGAPLVEAVGINNELERPHVIVHGGRYYLFWSTQRHTFAPSAHAGPTGLYAMVADRLEGPYAPVNGTGLVAANPACEPLQAYSWWVLPSLEVASFVDYWGLGGRSIADDPALLRGQFGGVPAPRVRLVIDGDRITLG